MDINDDTKRIVQELGSAINAAVEKSTDVSAALDRLREEGFELELTLKIEIGLREVSDDEPKTHVELDLTKDDLRTLKQMRIKTDD